MSYQTNQQKNSDLLSDDILSSAQAEHLEFLNLFTEKTLLVNKVPILNCLLYDFIQILNNMHLQELLDDISSEKDLHQKEVIV
jgi:hypothetical protein